MRACYKGTEPVSLKKTLRSVCKKIHSSFASDVKAANGTTDPEQVRRGDVYFAVLGEDDDLEECVGLALHRGCSAIVADRPVSGAESVPFFVISNVAEGFAAFCHAIYDFPAKSLKMIGITGTSGKTSTSYLISGMLAEAGYQVGLIGSLGVFDGSLFHPVDEENLRPDQIAAWLHRMVLSGCTHVVFEASSRAIADGSLAGIHFDAVCLTNIRRDHLDYHGTVEQYRRCKLGIFKYAKKKALAVCNIDDRITEAIAPLIDHPLLTVGMRNNAEVGAMLVERYPGEQTFIVTAGTEAVPFRTQIIGEEHIYNCLLATALGIGFEIDLKTIARGIERVESVPGRMERIECGQDFGVFVDAARTCDSLTSALRTIREITPGRLICVFGAGGYLESGKRALIGRTLESLADSVILTSATDRRDSEAAMAMCDIGQSFSSESGAVIMPDRAEAIAWALSEATSGDTVLIFGKGAVENSALEPEITPFCDRHFARQWLFANAEYSI